MKTITTGFFTTINSRMVRTALAFIFFPWKWSKIRKGDNVKRLEREFQRYLNTKNPIYNFWNGRSAIYHAIRLLDINPGDEIILQAYTCVSVPNAIIGAGATPIYCDIDNDTLNINPVSIEQKISSKTKAIIIQHTFGAPADIGKIKEICDSHKVVLIEDCAHALGAEFQKHKCGTFGDLSIFSLGRDKVISCVSGGFLLINNPDLNKKFIHNPQDLHLLQVLRSLFYIPISWIARKTYDFLSFGKIIIFLSRKLRLIPEVLTCAEKECNDSTFNYALPNCLAAVGLRELRNIDYFHRYRHELAEFYRKNLSNFSSQKYLLAGDPILLRYTVFADHSIDLMKHCRQDKIILGDWYRQVIAPFGVDLLAAQYHQGSCPVAEKRAHRTINLPNHPGVSLSDARRVVKSIREFYQNQDAN